MFKLDLKDAYFIIPVAEHHQKNLSFQWKERCFHFIFGLSTAPWAFTKVTRPVVQFLRYGGVRMVIYLDDMLFLDQKEENLPETRNLVLDLLESLGFLINYNKSEPSPIQTISFLGFIIDSQEMMIKLPPDKVDTTVKEAKNFPADVCPTVSTHDRGIFSSSTSSAPSPPSLQGATSPKTQGSRIGRLLVRGEPVRGSQERFGVVDIQHGQDEWSAHSSTAANHDHNIRCLSPRLGSSLQQLQDRRPLVSGRDFSPHQLPGPTGGLSGSEGQCMRREKAKELMDRCMRSALFGINLISATDFR